MIEHCKKLKRCSHFYSVLHRSDQCLQSNCVKCECSVRFCHTKKDEIRLATLVENGCAFEFFFYVGKQFFCRVATVQQQHSSQIPNSPSNSNERNKKITDRELKERRTNFLPRTCVSKRTKQQKRPKRYEFQFLTEETLKVYWIVKPMNVIILSVCVVAERPLLLLILPRVLCDTQAMCIYSISVCDTFNSARECCAERRGTCNTGAATHSTTHSTVWFAGSSLCWFLCVLPCLLWIVNCKLPNGNFCTIHIHHIAIASRCSVLLSFILSLGTHITISHYAPHNCRTRIRMKMDLSLIHIFTPSNHKKCVTQMSFSVACCIPWCHVLHLPFFLWLYCVHRRCHAKRFPPNAEICRMLCSWSQHKPITHVTWYSFVVWPKLFVRLSYIIQSALG